MQKWSSNKHVFVHVFCMIDASQIMEILETNVIQASHLYEKVYALITCK